MTGKETAMMSGILGFSGIFFISVQNLDYDNEMDRYKWLVYREFFIITIFFKIIVPIFFLVTKKDWFEYICRVFKDVFPKTTTEVELRKNSLVTQETGETGVASIF